MFAHRFGHLLVFQHDQRLDDPEAGIARTNDVVDITATGRHIGIGEIIGVLALVLLKFFPGFFGGLGGAKLLGVEDLSRAAGTLW